MAHILSIPPGYVCGRASNQVLAGRHRLVGVAALRAHTRVRARVAAYSAVAPVTGAPRAVGPSPVRQGAALCSCGPAETMESWNRWPLIAIARGTRPFRRLLPDSCEPIPSEGPMGFEALRQ